jgi:Domain of unknown function (DUF4365)
MSRPYATLDTNGRKARYGISYVRSICCQAGVTMTETEPDSDVLAVDCSVMFREADVRVQVKCTSQWTIDGKSLTYPVEEGWIRKWDECKVPVYFAAVIVPSDPDTWLRHDKDGTFHSTAAFWVRLVPGTVSTSIAVPKDQRLTLDTIKIWHSDLLALFTPRSES